MFKKNESATSKRHSAGHSARHSVLPAGTTLDGDLIGDGDITIEGTVNGNIRCRFLTLSGQPTIRGCAEAEVVNLCGNFTGELHASKVILNKSARMRGDLYYRVLEVQPGADFEGRVAPLEKARERAARPARAAPERPPESADSRQTLDLPETLDLPAGLALRTDPA